MIIALSSFGGRIFEFLLDVFQTMLSSQQRKTKFDASFTPVSKLLSIFNKGYCLDGRHCETITDSFKNAIVFGSTGNFKSSGILIPSILRMRGNCSLIINDPSQELQLKCSGALRKAGYSIKTINYNSEELSEGYNPLARAKSISQQQKISKMLINSSFGRNVKDPFWNLASENILNFSIKFILNHAPPENHNLFNVYHFISTLLYAPERIDNLIIDSKDETVISEYKTFLTYGDKTLASIIATCRAALGIFGTDPTVAIITGHDSINFSDCRKQRTAIFINTTVHDQKYYSVITNLFLQQFFIELMNALPNKKDLPVFFLLDEASSLYFEVLPVTLANCRKYACSILQVYQSKGQLLDLYGPALARSIIENSYAQVYMGGQSIQVAAELELLAGKFEYEDERGRHVRSLLTANEIHELKESLIILGNNPPIKTMTIPYFKQLRLNSLTNLPPYQPLKKVPFAKPSLMKFE